jgi:DNA polymerase II large subunit
MSGMGGDLSRNIKASSVMHEYFNIIQDDIEKCYKIAGEARKKGYDPEFEVEIPQALDLASRVEQLVGPKGIAPKIREVTKKIKNRELVSLEIAKEIVKGKKYKFQKTEDALDQAIRTGLAILTEGVLVAPLEGIAEVRLGKNKDGSNYVDLFFSGPIRSAGGTGQAMSVLIADVVRRELGIGKYLPTPGEIERYKEEIPLYKRAQHLQYTPSVDEIDKIVRGCPICIDGEGTEDEEVTGYRDLQRVGTNRLRGGACLVIAEGLCLKAPKILKHVKKLRLKGWDFLDIFVNKNKTDDRKKTKEIPEITPSSKYIGEVIAGRPVFSHPSRKGGFRLRYGRARTGGLASTAINPVSMYLMDGFIAVGTQLKTERPGKGTIGTPCTSIEGPIVLMQNGDLTELNDPKKVKKTEIKNIIDLGEILIPFGEFIENNSLLPDSSYVYEWWIQDLQKILGFLPENYSLSEIEKSDKKTFEKIKKDFGREINLFQPSPKDAFEISTKYKIPLHPYYNLFWHDINSNDLVNLSKYIKENGKIEKDKLVLPKEDEIKRILIEIGCLHKQKEGKLIFDRYSYPLIRCCGLGIKDSNIVESERFKILKHLKEENDVVSSVSKLAGINIMPRSPFRIGTRMGRPEKAAARKMRPPPHVLFPIGNFGGNQRLIRNAADIGTIEVEAGTRICTNCRKKTHRLVCKCGTHTIVGNGRIEFQQIKLAEELKLAQKNLNERNLPLTIKGVIGTISKHKTPEPLEKGILRAKYNVHVFKDGTIRFDMTDAPLTHFKPREINISINRLKELGYNKDYLGNNLENENQICELKVQDVIISRSCAEYFTQVAKFVDDLLVKFYKLERFYKIRKLEDLTGHLAVGLAPHTSAGSLSRIIGYADTQVCFAHPFYHAAKRRNCLSPGTDILISNSGMPIITNLEKLYQKINSNETIVDDFGTKQKNIHDIATFALNPINGKFEHKKIKSIIKTRAPRHLLKIKLRSGRDFISSSNHKVIVWSDEKIINKKALELNKNDYFLIPQKIDFYDKDIKKIDVLSEFLKLENESDDIVVRGVEKLVRKCVKQLGGLKNTSQILELNKKTFSNYIYRDSIPLLILLKLLRFCGEDVSSIPRESLLGVKRDHTVIPRLLKIDESFMRLIGYYISEGHARCTKKSCYQISFACSEEEICKDIVRCIKHVFDVPPSKSKKDVCISNRLIHNLFVNILHVGKNAKTKRIPSRFIALPKHKMKELLRTYFSGDGSVEKNRLHVTCSSVNRDLLRDIGFQLLRFGIFYRLKEERKKAGGAAKKFYDKKGLHPFFNLYYISIRSSYARKFCEEIGFSLKRKQKLLESAVPKERNPRIKKFGDFILDQIKEIVPVKSDFGFLYDIEVEDLHNFPINDFLLSNNCDGDEDGLMLLLDALLNFSHSYIPDKRGGKMDLPLILTTRIDPSEVDKEAHNVDTLPRYPLEFYESTLKHINPKDIEDKMGLVSSRLGTELQYEKFCFTHDTDNISNGPKMSNYKTLKTMMDKMNAQLSLAARIRAVDEADVAYKVIERHFLPDIIGNMRAFSKQSIRCPTCNISYRRPPLQGVCTKCGGKLTLTVHEKSVKKYLEISKDIAQRYNIPPYAQQRIVLVEKSIDSLFTSDKVKTTKLTDFL